MALDARRVAAVIHREMVQLAVLMAITAALFVCTRSLAASNRAISARDAGEWFRRGQAAAAAGRLDQATEDFRRATTRHRGNREYSLALSRALAATGEGAAARRELLALRDVAPEDPDVNLALARVDAAAGHVDEAQRFYYNALYAPWPLEQAEARRSVRLELIRYLAAHGNASRALAELIAADAGAPDDPAHQSEIAGLYLQVGDRRRALQHFQQVLARTPGDASALAGAGLAAFQLGDYPLASGYLGKTTDASGEVAEAREVVALIIANDPLAPRLGAAERRRRLTAVVDHARQRRDACPSAGSTPALPDVAAIRALDQDAVEAALDAVARAEALVVQQCGPAATLDTALGLIARLHGTGGQ